MNAEAALLGVPHQFMFEGQTYPVGLITGRIKAECERLLVARAKERLVKLKAQYNKKEYREELRLLGEREDKGEFAFGHNVQALLTTSWGLEMLTKLLMPTCPPEVLARILDERHDEIGWLVKDILEESMPISAKKAKEANDPFVPETAESPATASHS